MEITLTKIKIADLASDYSDNGENGVTAWGGRLIVRPPYQREFVYNDKQQVEVIKTVMKGFPLNSIYFAENADGTYEVIDGQQRITSICRFVAPGNPDRFAVDNKYMFNIAATDKALAEKILNYELYVYICKGTTKERLDWFSTINIAGAVLTKQELLNANYTGPWLAAAKKYFSKSNCPAYILAKDYIKGSPIRQELLETALEWVDTNPVDYMAKHQQDPDAQELINKFTDVINWVKRTFFETRKEMKGLNWGKLYDTYHTKTYDTRVLEDKIKELMMDDDVTKKAGVYEYVLSEGKEEKALSIRAFTEAQKRAAFTRQNCICPICGEVYPYEGMEADHITPWSRGGRTTVDNLQMICKKCNRTKSNK